MELLLNLAWLLLALPAYWLWRARRDSRGFSSLQCLVALACLLVILFPVVSATDDLCAMRTEMEEAPASKRSFRQTSGDKTGLTTTIAHNQAAMFSSVNFYPPLDHTWLAISTPSLFVPRPPAIEPTGRAPPSSLIG